MRAGPLSDRRIIDLLNRYFVSVYLVNEELWTLRGGGQQELDATVAVLDTD